MLLNLETCIVAAHVLFAAYDMSKTNFHCQATICSKFHEGKFSLPYIFAAYFINANFLWTILGRTNRQSSVIASSFHQAPKFSRLQSIIVHKYFHMYNIFIISLHPVAIATLGNCYFTLWCIFMYFRHNFFFFSWKIHFFSASIISTDK